MNKSQFVKELANATGDTQADASKFLESFLGLVPDVLKEEGTLQFTGFGTFTLTERAARKGRNPSTGKSIDIAASNQVKFKVGAALKATVNE